MTFTRTQKATCDTCPHSYIDRHGIGRCGKYPPPPLPPSFDWYGDPRVKAYDSCREHPDRKKEARK